MDAAIAHLQRFTQQHRGQLNAESYLEKLLRIQTAIAQGRIQAHIEWVDNESPNTANVEVPEPDPAWRNFAAQLQISAHTGNATSNADLVEESLYPDRVLPLPQALRHALASNDWSGKVLDICDDADRDALPLEVALWHYLQAVQSQASLHDIQAAKQAVDLAIQREQQAPSYDSETWLRYLCQHWQALVQAKQNPVESGKAWLMDLLDRYRLLPEVLLAA